VGHAAVANLRVMGVSACERDGRRRFQYVRERPVYINHLRQDADNLRRASMGVTNVNEHKKLTPVCARVGMN